MEGVSQSKAFTKKEIHEFGESVLEEIARAFRGVSIKGGVTISEAYAIDDYEPDDVRAAARASDTYQKWTDVDVRQDMGGSALTFMDPIGFRFHLPAYMSLVVRVELGDVPNTDSNCLIKFEQSWMFEQSNELHSEQFSIFDHAQRRAVARFL
ncbi:MAG: DUF6714 family protein [Planctomycetota bacterium]